MFPQEVLFYPTITQSPKQLFLNATEAPTWYGACFAQIDSCQVRSMQGRRLPPRQNVGETAASYYTGRAYNRARIRGLLPRPCHGVT